MDMMGVLCMNGGEGKTSYAENSWIQQEVLLLTKPAREEAIRITYDNFFPAENNKYLVIAELGCSSGSTALSTVRELIQAIDTHHISSSAASNQQIQYPSPNLHFYLNDLPSNDFNTIFKSLPSFHDRLKRERRSERGASECFIYGVAGTFYGPLFESRSLHFVHSSYSLHWLSKVPEGLARSNKESIYLSRKSPPNVINAYYQQFRNDFSTFLKCRSKELVDGGCMVLTLIGRSEDQLKEDGGPFNKFLATALNQMVLEGLIDEEKMDLFNVPAYYPSTGEIKDEVAKEASFNVINLQVSEVNLNPTLSTTNNYNHEISGKEDRENASNNTKTTIVPFVRCMRAVFEPILVDYFGEAIIEEVFKRYNEVVIDFFAKGKYVFYNITISLIKKAIEYER